jgi:hypothetical protein
MFGNGRAKPLNRRLPPASRTLRAPKIPENRKKMSPE